jgi:hypothetical protein
MIQAPELSPFGPTKVKVGDNDKHSSLLRYGFHYCLIKMYEVGHFCSAFDDFCGIIMLGLFFQAHLLCAAATAIAACLQLKNLKITLKNIKITTPFCVSSGVLTDIVPNQF